MRIKTLTLHDYCGYRNAKFEFGDFTCLYGPNGIGKTTVLNAISLLLSSLDFKTEDRAPFGMKPPSEQTRIQAALKRNIRNVDDPDGCKAFRASAVFEHEGKEYEVVLTEKGWEKNEILDKPFWWAGLCYFARFDSDMVNFQLRYDLWPKFKKAYEGITGIEIEPDVYTETDLKNLKKKGECTEYVIGFNMLKPTGKVHSRRGSAGERKIAKALSQVVNLEDGRRPNIVLVDNLEMHVHYKRHLRMVDEVKALFGGMQIISTTHSPVLIEQYQPNEEMVNIEDLLIKQHGEEKMSIKPTVDTEKMAEEIKRYLNGKKFDLVDYGYVEIETYPPPDSDEYPEIKKFSAQWAEFFDAAEKAVENTTEEPGELTLAQMLEKYKPELAENYAEFDKKTAEVAALVNGDQQFWSNLREIVLPLYEKSPYYEQWKEGRWKSVDISYDPTPLEVVTTQMWTNQQTGERIRGEQIRKTEYPAGFIIKIN